MPAGRYRPRYLMFVKRSVVSNQSEVPTQCREGDADVRARVRRRRRQHLQPFGRLLFADGRQRRVQLRVKSIQFNRHVVRVTKFEPVCSILHMYIGENENKLTGCFKNCPCGAQSLSLCQRCQKNRKKKQYHHKTLG